MKRTIIRKSQEVVYSDLPVLIVGDGVRVDKVVVSGSRGSGLDSEVSQDSPIVEIRGNDNRVADIAIFGNALSWSKQFWKDTVMSGLRINGDLNKVGYLSAESVHIPYTVRGYGNKMISMDARWFSGDGFNLCGSDNEIFKAYLKGGLSVWDYEEYHPDIGMIFEGDNDVSCGGVVSGCNVYNTTYETSSHKWNDKKRQGILTDAPTQYCGVYNLNVIGEIQEEHGVSFAAAEYCEVMNINTRSKVNWNKKPEMGVSSNNRVCGGWSK